MVLLDCVQTLRKSFSRRRFLREIAVKCGRIPQEKARRTGLEPATPGSTVRYSNRLSYRPLSTRERESLWRPLGIVNVREELLPFPEFRSRNPASERTCAPNVFLRAPVEIVSAHPIPPGAGDPPARLARFARGMIASLSHSPPGQSPWNWFPRNRGPVLTALPAQSPDLYACDVTVIPGSSPVPAPACDVCGAQTARPRYAIAGIPFHLALCPECRVGRLLPAPTNEQLAAFYPAEYYGSSGKKFQGYIERLVRLVGDRHARFLARNLPPGARVLDVGCGRGVTLRALADLGCEAHGFEVSADAVEGLDPRIQARVAPSLEAAEFPAEFFDEIILWHVLEHVRQPREVMCEVWRLLKPGGRAIVAVPNLSSWQARWAGPAWFHLDLPRHLYHFPERTLQRMLQEIGFQCGRSHHFSLRQNPYGWIQSLQNKCSWLPRNGLYMLLHRRKQGSRVHYSGWTKFQLRAMFWLLAPLALGLSVLAALCKQGATIHIVGKKP